MMKEKNPLTDCIQIDQIGSANNLSSISPFKKLKILLTAFAIVVVPIQPLFADTGDIAVQFEFSLSSKPKFKQFNLVFQNNHGTTDTHLQFYENRVDKNLYVPLYSANGQVPGLFNYFLHTNNQLKRFGIDSEAQEGKQKHSFGMILLSVGLVAIMAASIKQDLDNGCSGTEVALTILAGNSTEWCYEDNP
jgi:hypothetical protein